MSLERTLLKNKFKILDMVEPQARVLDLGCGNGELLKLLKEKKNIKGYGVEIDENHIIECVSNNISVIQGNLDKGLHDYGDHSFDYCLLIQTLQVVYKPKIIIQEMLRVGRKAIISFPNFAYWKNRTRLFFWGRMPVNKEFPYSWFDTPNIHMLTIEDFREFCHQNGIIILEEFYINSMKIFNNSFSPTGLFLIKKD